jgi:hypothetical protein
MENSTHNLRPLENVGLEQSASQGEDTRSIRHLVLVQRIPYQVTACAMFILTLCRIRKQWICCTNSLFSQAMENWHLAFQDHFLLLSNPHHYSGAAFANQMAQVLVDSIHLYLSRRRHRSQIPLLLPPLWL